jgi:hypothetical protein
MALCCNRRLPTEDPPLVRGSLLSPRRSTQCSTDDLQAREVDSTRHPRERRIAISTD